MRTIFSLRVNPNTRELVFLTAEVTGTEFPRCDFCSAQAEYDGKTVMGPWAYMCQTHFEILGVGLGLGKGQRLAKKEPGKALESYVGNRPTSSRVYGRIEHGNLEH